MKSNMYAIRPNINFINLFWIFVLTKNISSMAINMHPIEPKDIHILSIEETNSNCSPTFHENSISHEKRVAFLYNSFFMTIFKTSYNLPVHSSLYDALGNQLLVLDVPAQTEQNVMQR